MLRSALLALALCACSDRPSPTGAVCPDPDPGEPTWDDFAMPFFDKYCINCHDHSIPRSMRNKAPIDHDFDTLERTLDIANHTDEQAGIGLDATNRFMPPSRCPSVKGGALDIDCLKPTDDERRQLAVWLACELNRPHNFRPDAGVDAP